MKYQPLIHLKLPVISFTKRKLQKPTEHQFAFASFPKEAQNVFLQKKPCGLAVEHNMLFWNEFWIPNKNPLMTLSFLNKRWQNHTKCTDKHLKRIPFLLWQTCCCKHGYGVSQWFDDRQNEQVFALFLVSTKKEEKNSAMKSESKEEKTN